jgi:hypothetical protein
MRLSSASPFPPDLPKHTQPGSSRLWGDWLLSFGLKLPFPIPYSLFPIPYSLTSTVLFN